ncbi:MAG: hypothetical protein UR61_C0012G0008 [candidate division WS6 bacterium GW2011_GWE1_34_7]|uniref:Lipoprotein n=1 Tax=candidate division WS6 bacterium GW2011_GWE1_34_7 TaxID=1619093 RepID=A0A0G0BQ53_9BACT|nr:MAG: hypothetical protein UR61_C0012G0008 [candidate division WS6 bacterium GW2011_GWE1_34_7]
MKKLSMVLLVLLVFALTGCDSESELDGFAVKQVEQGQPFWVLLLGEKIFPIVINPCENHPMDMDPQNELGGKWSLYFFRLPAPHGDVVVLYFNGRPIRMTPLITVEGNVYQCPNP